MIHVYVCFFQRTTRNGEVYYQRFTPNACSTPEEAADKTIEYFSSSDRLQPGERIGPVHVVRDDWISSYETEPCNQPLFVRVQ